MHDIHFMRALQHVADKVCTSCQEKSVHQVGIPFSESEWEGHSAFQGIVRLSGETFLQSLPQQLYHRQPLPWTPLLGHHHMEIRVQWWTNPMHLSMIIM